MPDQDSISLTALERRREQNRLAQRRYRRGFTRQDVSVHLANTMRRSERHDPRKARKTPEVSPASVLPEANLEEQRVTRSRGQSSTGSTATPDFAHDSYPDTDGGNGTSQGAGIFPFDEHMTFGDSLDPFALPEMASNLPRLAQPSTQDTTEAVLHRFPSDNTCLLLEPATTHATPARRDTPLHMAVKNGSGKIVRFPTVRRRLQRQRHPRHDALSPRHRRKPRQRSRHTVIARRADGRNGRPTALSTPPSRATPPRTALATPGAELSKGQCQSA